MKLQAKNKKTGEIVEFTAHDDYYGKHRYGFEDMRTTLIIPLSMFDTLYERIEEEDTTVSDIWDTPPTDIPHNTTKGWRERFIKNCTDGKNEWRSEASPYDILRLIESIEQQAYARAAEVARTRGLIYPYKGESLLGYPNACKDIAQAIEQLSSNNKE